MRDGYAMVADANKLRHQCLGAVQPTRLDPFSASRFT